MDFDFDMLFDKGDGLLNLKLEWPTTEEVAAISNEYKKLCKEDELVAQLAKMAKNINNDEHTTEQL